MHISNRVANIPKSAIHEMTRLSRQIEDVAFLSWAKPTSGAPDFIGEAAMEAIHHKLVDGYSVSTGLSELRQEIVKKLPHFTTLRNVFINATPRPNLPFYTLISDALQRNINGLLSGKIDANEALSSAQKDIQKIVNQYGRTL